MSDTSRYLDYLRRQAKKLHREVSAGDPTAVERAMAVFRDLRQCAPEKLPSRFGLQRAQHVIAMESGFGPWSDLVKADEMLLALVAARIRAGFRAYLYSTVADDGCDWDPDLDYISEIDNA